MACLTQHVPSNMSRPLARVLPHLSEQRHQRTQQRMKLPRGGGGGSWRGRTAAPRLQRREEPGRGPPQRCRRQPRRVGRLAHVRKSLPWCRCRVGYKLRRQAGVSRAQRACVRLRAFACGCAGDWRGARGRGDLGGGCTKHQACLGLCGSPLAHGRESTEGQAAQEAGAHPPRAPGRHGARPLSRAAAGWLKACSRRRSACTEGLFGGTKH